MADVFKRKKQRWVVTPNDQEYNIHYLGSMRTVTAKGEKCCELPVRKIWKNTSSGQRYVRVKLFVGSKGIRLKRVDSASAGDRKEDREQYFHLHRISQCVADQYHPMVFAWVYRHELPRMQVSLRVHVAVCTKEEKASEIATTITQLFHTAFEQFKREKKVSDRKLEPQNSEKLVDKSWSDDDSEEGGSTMSKALPPTPLRKIINTRSTFKPPLAHRLSFRTEMHAIRESEDERKENGAAKFTMNQTGLPDSLSTCDPESFDDFLPADIEL